MDEAQAGHVASFAPRAGRAIRATPASACGGLRTATTLPVDLLAALTGAGRIDVREQTLELPRWPARLDGVRAAVVSDLHAGTPGVRVQRIVELVHDAEPDLVLLLGDYVDPTVIGGERPSPAAVAQGLAELRAPLGVFTVLGNHDWAHTGPVMKSALEAAGLPVLENEAVRIELRRGPLWVAGIAEEESRDPRVGEALEGVPEGEPVIVLAHQPDLFPYVPARAALTVSGHNHGGQVDIPWLRSRVIPSRHGDRYKAGHIVEHGRHLFVSRGIGTSRLPLRFRARPEVPVLRLVGSRG
jgi:predicted MPP superfamily phosphohydrolase